MEDFIPDISIASLIPQRPPFIMVDGLVEASIDRIRTYFQVRADNIFLEEQYLREFALIENICQSSAAGLAYVEGYAGKQEIDGFIGGISKLEVFELARLGDRIQTIVTPLHQLGHMYLLHGVTYVDERKLLTCQVKLVGLAPTQAVHND